MSRYSLLTGATDLLGRYLLRDLLVKNERVAVIVERTQTQAVRERIETIVQGCESALQQNLARPQCIEGSVTEPRLGLTGSDFTWIQSNCRRMIHAATSLETHGGDDASEPWQTNVRGTSSMLGVCERCRIDDLHFISSAFVSGNRTDTIHENQLDANQSFRNDFEASRFEAEVLARSTTFFSHLTVYRPTTMCGDSETGYTNSYTGIYNELQRLANTLGPRILGDHNDAAAAVFNNQWQCVPVDWVSAVICQILGIPNARNRTYHVAPATPITSTEIHQAALQFFADSDRPTTMVATDDGIVGEADVPRSGDTGRFDRTNLLRFASDRACPVITPEVIGRYLQFAQSDRWGQAPERPARVPAWSDAIVAAARLDVIDALMDGIGTTSSKTLGLDVVGPGGGQWSLHRGPDKLLAIVPGLPRASDRVVTVTTYDLLRLLESPVSRAA